MKTRHEALVEQLEELLIDYDNRKVVSWTNSLRAILRKEREALLVEKAGRCR